VLLSSSLMTFFFAFVAGLFGALLGLGGGLVVIPALTLVIGIPIHEAIGASIVSVIATSSGSAMAYVQDKITSVRIGMFLETATTLGAVTGAYIAGLVSVKTLYLIFAVLMLYSAATMTKRRNLDFDENQEESRAAAKLRLSGQYFDKVYQREIKYKVTGVLPAWLVNYGAGILSGLLGIGGGAFKVLGMDIYMKLPLKVSTATSNFMMGVTAAASAGVYFTRGDVNPLVAGPVALGVLAGAQLGTKIMQMLPSKLIRYLFIPVLVFLAMQMLWKVWWM